MNSGMSGCQVGRGSVVLASLMSTSHKLETFGKRNLSWENALISMACEQGCRAFLIDDRWGRIQLTVGCLSPEHVVLGSMKKQTEPKEHANNQHASKLPVPLYASRIVP